LLTVKSFKILYSFNYCVWSSKFCACVWHNLPFRLPPNFLFSQDYPSKTIVVGLYMYRHVENNMNTANVQKYYTRVSESTLCPTPKHQTAPLNRAHQPTQSTRLPHLSLRRAKSLCCPTSPAASFRGHISEKAADSARPEPMREPIRCCVTTKRRRNQEREMEEVEDKRLLSIFKKGEIGTGKHRRWR
jgi:hypothetical protein